MEEADRLSVLETGASGQRRLLAKINMPEGTHSIAVANRRVYSCGSGQGLVLIDARDPARAAVLFRLPLPGKAFGLTLALPLILVPSGSEGLCVAVEGGGDTLRLLTVMKTPDKAVDAAVDGKRAIVADGDSGVLLLDLSRPGEPAVAGRYHADGFVNAVALSSSLAALSILQKGVQVLKWRGLGQPVPESVYPGLTWVSGIIFSGRKLMVTDYWEGLLAIDLRKPARPLLFSKTGLTGNALCLALKGSTAYILDSWEDLVAIDLKVRPENPVKGDSIPHAETAMENAPMTEIQSPTCWPIAFRFIGSWSGRVRVYDLYGREAVDLKVRSEDGIFRACWGVPWKRPAAGIYFGSCGPGKAVSFTIFN